MQYLKTFLVVFVAALLVFWAAAPAAYASTASLPAPDQRISADDDEDDDDEDDDDEDDDDEDNVVPAPAAWTPFYSYVFPNQGNLALTYPVPGAFNRGLAAPLGTAGNYVIVGNLPAGPGAVPAPPYDRNMPWGSFGTYQNWANAFFFSHGRLPNQQDEVDYWASQAYAAQTGSRPWGW